MRIIYNFLLAFACDVSRKKSAKFERVYLRAGRAAENFCWHDVGFAVLDLRSNLYAEKPSIPETVAVPSASAGLKFCLRRWIIVSQIKLILIFSDLALSNFSD